MLRIILTATVLLAASCQSSEAQPAAQSVAAPLPETMVSAAKPLTEFQQKMARLTPRVVDGRPAYNYCDVFGCVACPPGSPCPPVQTASIIHCCNDDGICVHVQLMGSCDMDFYVVICDWGQSNADGTITCYE